MTALVMLGRHDGCMVDPPLTVFAMALKWGTAGVRVAMFWLDPSLLWMLAPLAEELRPLGRRGRGVGQLLGASVTICGSQPDVARVLTHEDRSLGGAG